MINVTALVLRFIHKCRLQSFFELRKILPNEELFFSYFGSGQSIVHAAIQEDLKINI